MYDLSNARRVVCHEGKRRHDRTFYAAEDAAKFLRRVNPDGYSLYHFADGRWTTTGCPELPEV